LNHRLRTKHARQRQNQCQHNHHCGGNPRCPTEHILRATRTERRLTGAATEKRGGISFTRLEQYSRDQHGTGQSVND
jgi:hypothetical protein